VAPPSGGWPWRRARRWWARRWWAMPRWLPGQRWPWKWTPAPRSSRRRLPACRRRIPPPPTPGWPSNKGERAEAAPGDPLTRAGHICFGVTVADRTWIRQVLRIHEGFPGLGGGISACSACIPGVDQVAVDGRAVGKQRVPALRVGIRIDAYFARRQGSGGRRRSQGSGPRVDACGGGHGDDGPNTPSRRPPLARAKTVTRGWIWT